MTVLTIRLDGRGIEVRTSATAATDQVPRSARDRTGTRPGEDEDPPGALLGRPHPPRSLEAPRPRDRPEPEGRQGQAARLPGQAGGRPQVGATSKSNLRAARRSSPGRSRFRRNPHEVAKRSLQHAAFSSEGEAIAPVRGKHGRVLLLHPGQARRRPPLSPSRTHSCPRGPRVC